MFVFCLCLLWHFFDPQPSYYDQPSCLRVQECDKKCAHVWFSFGQAGNARITPAVKKDFKQTRTSAGDLLYTVANQPRGERHARPRVGGVQAVLHKRFERK
jgi:hypothetical protein